MSSIHLEYLVGGARNQVGERWHSKNKFCALFSQPVHPLQFRLILSMFVVAKGTVCIASLLNAH